MTEKQKLAAEIAQRQQMLEQLEKNEVSSKQAEWDSKCKSLIGKVYKRISSSEFSTNRNWKDNHPYYNTVEYRKIIGIHESLKQIGSTHLVFEPLVICLSPIGWSMNKDNKLQFNFHPNYVKTNKKRVNDVSDLMSGTYNASLVDTVISFDEYNNPAFQSWNGDFYWEVTEKEYVEAQQISGEIGKYYYEKLGKFMCYNVDTPNLDKIQKTWKHITFEKINPWGSESTLSIIDNLDNAVIQRLNDLFELVKNEKVSIKTLVESLSGKVAKYNYFNADYSLPELAQYDSHKGDKGVHLIIKPGDDGTDYEPYVTHYYVDFVHIDWKKILYPIRLNLSCGVLDLEAKLEALTEVYNVDSWVCDYDTSSYDAYFIKAYLKSEVLNKVNQLIQQHIK